MLRELKRGVRNLRSNVQEGCREIQGMVRRLDEGVEQVREDIGGRIGRRG
jgi:hypothetical protein